GHIINSDGYRGSNTTSVTIDDSLNPTPTSYIVGPSSVSASMPEPGPFFEMMFGSAVVNRLELSGGSGGNTVTLTETKLSPSPQQVVLNTGLGADTVTIEQTHTNVVVNGQDGADVVNVGQGGNVQGITRQLTITNIGD